MSGVPAGSLREDLMRVLEFHGLPAQYFETFEVHDDCGEWILEAVHINPVGTPIRDLRTFALDARPSRRDEVPALIFEDMVRIRRAQVSV